MPESEHPETARPAQAAILELVEIFKDVIAGRGSDAGGLLGLLVQLASDESSLTWDEIYAQCVMLLRIARSMGSADRLQGAERIAREALMSAATARALRSSVLLVHAEGAHRAVRKFHSVRVPLPWSVDSALKRVPTAGHSSRLAGRRAPWYRRASLDTLRRAPP